MGVATCAALISMMMLLASAFLIIFASLKAHAGNPLIDVSSLDSSIHVEMRYFSEWNFVGRKIDGYEANKCLLTPQAARALVLVQKELKAQRLSLLVMDCYRPQRAVDEFFRWSQDEDRKMEKIFYAEENKADLFENGYIARKSGHSRGSTVDLTLVKIGAGKRLIPNGLRYQESPVDCRNSQSVTITGQLDMGTMMDCFSKKSATEYPDISAQARRHRQLLKSLMEKHGFTNYSKEWWHYTLKNEPYPEKAFDFVVK